MKTKLLLTALFLTGCGFVQAQNHLPLRNSFSFGAGMAYGISKSRSDYLDATNKPVCFDVGAEFRHYFVPTIALGVAYEYIGSSKNGSRMNCHFIAPTLSFRKLWAENRKGFWGSAGIGYLHYSDKLEAYHHGYSTLSEGHFALSAAIGYEFAIGQGSGMFIKLQATMADWESTPDYSHWDYEHGPYTLSDNDLSYFSLGVGLTFGK